ncbi:hypothetical protein SDRG_17019 [Saprolegnia diclina VS20]|uniref:SAP domain-containing protein n=1 Tax=Saprolegnia diclina (strain VS20) TaxID=1156394 RepID=T0QZB4_SAPDV|nr:hypothetical protein SDRG_17019 [Saprolegnia diclina VS20]EQC25093.1 hypothetical protein SDRG_17019 [Saprolegnia diclina VS20]|eukprot:XP_008621474.1 hypothetical protein SDRG_17019 [Saprolegnia diclina VS20]
MRLANQSSAARPPNALMTGSDKLQYSTFDQPSVPKHPADTAGLISRATFSWTHPLLELGNKRQIAPADLWVLEAPLQAAPLTNRFANGYVAHGQRLLRTFFGLYGWRLAAIGCLELLSVAGDLYGPVFVLGEILTAIDASDLDATYVLQLITSLFLVQAANAFVKVHAKYQNERVGIELSTVLRSLLFAKALRLSHLSRKTTSAGDIANLCTLDATNVMNFATSVHQIWMLPVQIVVVLYRLYTVVGWPIFVGLGVLLLVLALNTRVAGAMGDAQLTFMMAKDQRMKLTSEVFGAIAVVKLNAWEDNFRCKLNALRATECQTVWRFLLVLLTLTSFTNCTPIFVSVAVFATFALAMPTPLTVTIVFSTMALLKSLQDPLIDFPVVVSTMVQSLVSAKRINDVLLMDEVDPTNVSTPSDPIASVYAKDQVVLAIDNASFTWDSTTTPTFTNVNLRITRGELVVLHGAVGQGKSSLCSALLGEMQKLTGSVFVGGQVAYFAQQAWIQNTTIRENILFGKPYDRSTYQKVLDACALQSDLASLPAGDRTEIGQKGINLSGGQKARIALARACYSDADIFILDSPLSAVDAIVASEIFTKCFLGLLAKKTVLLVTHNPEIIESAAVARTLLVQDGRLIESTHDSPRTRQEATSAVTPLKARTPYWEESEIIEYPAPGPRHEMLVTPSLRTPYSYNAREMLYTPREPVAGESFEESGRLIADEERAEGRVAGALMWSYLRHVGGWPTVAVVLTLTIAMQLLKVASDLWLARWSNGGEGHATLAASAMVNMAIYAGLALGSCLLIALQTYAVISFGVQGSRKLFDAMLSSVLAAPMAFFDTNPIGRILNRFGDDVTSCDMRIPFSLGPILFELSSLACTVGTAVVLSQWVGLLVLPLLYVYYSLGAFFVGPLRDINRIKSTSRSPLLSFIAQGIDGASTIRSFGPRYTRRMTRICNVHVEALAQARVADVAVNAWYSLRLQLLAVSIVAITMTAVVVLHSQLSAGIIGLLMTYSLAIPSTFTYLVAIWANLEIFMIAPERIQDEDDNQSIKSVAAVVRDPTKLKVPELRKALSERNLSTFGLKAKLVERLTRALADEKARDARRVTPDVAGFDDDDDDDDAILPRLKSKTTKSSTKNAAKLTTSTEPLPRPSPDADVAPRLEARVKATEVPLREPKVLSPVKPASPVKSASPVQRVSSPVAVATSASSITTKPSPMLPVATSSMSSRVSEAASEPSPVVAASPPRPAADSFVEESPMASPERPPPMLHSPGKVRSKDRKRKTLFPPESPASTSSSLAPPSDGPILSTAASLFASATSPIVKGFASFRSALGLSATKPTDETEVASVVKVTAQVTRAVVASPQRGPTSPVRSSPIAASSPVRSSPIAASSPVRSSAVVASSPRRSSPVVISSPPRRPTKTPPSPKPVVPALQTEIERESYRMRQQAREFARRRIEEESKAARSVPEAPEGDARRPTNLVSGLYSFSSLAAKPAPKPVATVPAISSLKLAERHRALEPKKAIDRAKRKEGLMKMYEEQRRLDEEKRRKTAAQVAAEAERQKQERDAAERRQREAEVARKRAARLQEIQAATDEKRRQVERTEKLRHEQPRAKVETTAKPAASKPRVEIAKPLSAAASASAKVVKKKPIEAVLLSKKPEPTTYEMSEPESDESGNGEDDTKAVPKWAQKAHLEKALAKQFGPDAIDPTPSIFPEFIATCDLEAIFQPRDGAKKRKFARRTSSGNWLADRPTTRDKVAYKKAMGYTN